jgi:cyanobactin biosynthesis protein (PatB/AcyB/McaB family)
MTHTPGKHVLPLAPRQAPPVRRPDLVAPHTAVDLVHGDADEIGDILLDLLLGANYNDPQSWRMPSYDRLKLSGAGA